MIRYATPKDINNIKTLFNACFPEDIDFNECIFAKILAPNNVLINITEGIILGMLIRLNFFITDIGEVTYLYGCCTKEEYRGRGIMAKLIDFSHTEDIKKGIAGSILIPANTSLFSFYKKLGYKTSGYINKASYSLQKPSHTYDIAPITKNEIPNINVLYEGSQLSSPHIERSTSYWSTLIELFTQLDGYALAIKLNNKLVGYAFAWSDYIQELCSVNLEYEEDILKAVISHIGSTKITATLMHKPCDIPYTMLKAHTVAFKAFYSNMLFD